MCRIDLASSIVIIMNTTAATLGATFNRRLNLPVGIRNINLLNLQRLGLRKINIDTHGVITDDFNFPIGLRRLLCFI